MENEHKGGKAQDKEKEKVKENNRGKGNEKK